MREDLQVKASQLALQQSPETSMASSAAVQELSSRLRALEDERSQAEQKREYLKTVAYNVRWWPGQSEGPGLWPRLIC